MGTYQTYVGQLPEVDCTKYASIKSLEDLVEHNDLINFGSCTACYLDVNLRNKIFYRDQQDCVIWKFESPNVVAYYDVDYGIDKWRRVGIVANSLAEFLARIEIENTIWFVCDDCNDWNLLQNKLNEKCLKYLEFYYQHEA
jgi:hypothetical protein